MSTDNEFISYVMEQLSGAGLVAQRKMFGEFAVYLDAKVVALVCDNQLFVKPTEAGRILLGKVKTAPPYPGAKDYFLIDDKLDDNEFMAELIRATAKELPAPKLKKKVQAKKS
jgi:TfoX/Sxy family transcriptional regulator of competence genes